MKVRILQSIASRHWSYEPGQIVDLKDLPPEGRKWIDGVRAELVREGHAPEVATVSSPERAVQVRARPRVTTGDDAA